MFLKSSQLKKNAFSLSSHEWICNKRMGRIKMARYSEGSLLLLLRC